MRVISGIVGGRKLKSPDGEAVRPTTDHVKEAIFNILQFDLEGRRVLDLFGGSGQMGIEALSRGAREAVFTDNNRSSIALIRDALSFLSRGEKFDVIFVDPPYDSGLYAPVLQRINAVDNLTEGGIIMCEARAGTELPDMLEPYHKLRERRYGSVKICLYTKAVYEERQ